MRKKIYAVFIISLLGLIPIIIMTFKYISDRKIASLFASGLFFALTLTHLYKKKKTENEIGFVTGKIHQIWWAGYLQFLVFFAAPIFLLRILNFETDFSELSILGVPGPILHHYSSYSYTALVFVNILMLIKIKKPQ